MRTKGNASYKLSMKEMGGETVESYGKSIDDLKKIASKAKAPSIATITSNDEVVWIEMINPYHYLLVVHVDQLPRFSSQGSDKTKLIKEGCKYASSVRTLRSFVRLTTTKTNKTVFVASYLNGKMEWKTYYADKVQDDH